jgi:hypothetical protein
VLESEVYPVWSTRGNGARARKAKESRPEQRSLNQKNAVKNVTRLINTNFTDADMWGTVTYSDEHLPQTMDEAVANMGKFTRRLRIYAKKHGFAPLKYVHMTEFGESRVHHHIVTNFPDRDVFEKLWQYGGRKQTRRLQADEYAYTGMSIYTTKDPKTAKTPKSKKKFVTSRNLTKPTITVTDYKFSRSKANKVAMGELDAKTVFETMYKDYRYNDIKVRFSDYVSGAYLYARMVRRN